MITRTQIRTRLKNESVWNEQRVALEPLLGTFNGTNRVFRTAYAPVDNGSVTVYDGNMAEIDSELYSLLDERNGVILFVTAPAALMYASFTVVDITSDTLDRFISEGLNEMERRINRGYTWYADEGGELHLSASATSGVDPIVHDGSRFSQNGQQVGYLTLCCKYVVAASLSQRSTANAISYREERSGGLMVDTTKAPGYWHNLVSELDRQLEAMRFDVTGQYGGMAGGGRFKAETEWVLGERRDEY